MRLKTELSKSSSVRFTRTRAEERSDLNVELSFDVVELSSDLIEMRSASVLVTRTRAEESSDLVELS